MLPNILSSKVGMGQRFVISVTKNEAKNEVGCNQKFKIA